MQKLPYGDVFCTVVGVRLGIRPSQWVRGREQANKKDFLCAAL